MDLTFFMGAILAVSLITSLTVEAIKKLLDETTVNYSSNVLAAIVAVLIAVAVSVMYMIMQDITFSAKIVVQIIALTYLSFLCATVGYDKVKQMIEQIVMTKARERELEE